MPQPAPSWVLRGIVPLGGTQVGLRLRPPGTSRRTGDERLVLLRGADPRESRELPVAAGPPGPVQVVLDLGHDGGPQRWAGSWRLAVHAPQGPAPVVADTQVRNDIAVVPGDGAAFRVAEGGGTGAATVDVTVVPPFAESVRVTDVPGQIELALTVPYPAADLPRPADRPGPAVVLVRRTDGRRLRYPAPDLARAGVELAGAAAAHVDGREVWDVRLEGVAAAAVPVARHLDGVAAKRHALQYAWRQVGDHRAQAYWTLRDELAVAVERLPAVAAAEGPEPTPTPSRRSRRARACGSLVTVLPWLWRLLDRLPPPRQDPARPTVRFLLLNAYGMGGTIRTTLGTADSLRDRYDVEVVTLKRDRDQPVLPFPEGLRVRVLDPGHRLVDPRLIRLRAALDALPSVLVDPQEPGYGWLSLWTDLLLLREIRSRRGGILVTTRVGFNLLAARHAPPWLVLVGQEHRHAGSYRTRLSKAVASEYRLLDALTVLTGTDETDYGRILRGAPTRIERLPNAVPELAGTPARVRLPVILAAGRMKPTKGFDLLIDAFAQVADQRPDWSLRLYGLGTDLAALRARVHRLGLTERVLFPGMTEHLGEELSRAGVFALSSRHEGFPMVLLEAMGMRTPVVSFDCPTGPGELVVDGENGLLVPDLDVDAFAAALLRATGDAGLRDALATNALSTAQAYGLTSLSGRWDALFRGLLEAQR